MPSVKAAAAAFDAARDQKKPEGGGRRFPPPMRRQSAQDQKSPPETPTPPTPTTPTPPIPTTPTPPTPTSARVNGPSGPNLMTNGVPSNRSANRPPPTSPAQNSKGLPPPPPPANNPKSLPPAPPPPAPPAPPAPPPPPPPPPDESGVKKVQSAKAQKTLLKLRQRPRRRPDWTCLMKEIENGKKLRKVETNDRSQPLLSRTKSRGKFVYDSEKPNLHTQLLVEIQKGIKLKKVEEVKDRSRPNLDGLKKGFRRQLTIEEQQHAAEDGEPQNLSDDLDDIDKVRDDLQATKQLLEIELANKTQHEQELKNLRQEVKKMQEDLRRFKESSKKLEVENQDLKEKLKTAPKVPQGVPTKDLEGVKKDFSVCSFSELDAFDDEYRNLQERLREAREQAQDWKEKCASANKNLQAANAQVEDMEHRCLILEKRLKSKAGPVPSFNNKTVQTEEVIIVSNRSTISAQVSVNEGVPPQAPSTQGEAPQPPSSEPTPRDTEEEEEEEESTETETETGSEEEDEDDAEEKKVERELKFLTTKLKNTKERGSTAKTERRTLRDQIKSLQKSIAKEKKNYLKMKKEVDELGKLLASGKSIDKIPDLGDLLDEEDSEEESTSSSSEDEDDDEAPSENFANLDPEAKRTRFNECIKFHEDALGKTKKSNFLLKAQVDKLQEDLSKEKGKMKALEEELTVAFGEMG